MISAFASLFFVGDPHVADDEDSGRLSSVGTIESELGTKWSDTASEDLQCDHHPVDPPSTSSCPPSCTDVKTPEIAYTLGRSASSPPAFRRASMIPLSPSPYQHQKLSRSAHTLRAPLPPIKPLSPIYEPVDLAYDENDVHVVTSPAPSPSSLRERISPAESQGKHPVFIKRCLKRSLSKTSASSLRSVASGAPKLPPLNLRPSFNSNGSLLSSPQHSPPSAQSSQSYTTPQSVTSPRTRKFSFFENPQKYCAIYEDGSSERTGSFVTARSVATEPGPFIITKHDIPSSADLVIHTYEGSATTHGAIEETMDVPVTKDLLEASVDIGRDGSGRSNSIASTTTKNNSENGEDGLAKETRNEGESDGESFVMRRWRNGIMTLRKFPDEFPKAKDRDATNYTKQACLLFWLGFAAPWCWLIGGWMLLEKVETEDSEQHTDSHKTTLKRGEMGSLMGTEEKAEYMKSFKKLVFPHRSARFTASSSILVTHSSLTLRQEMKGKTRLNVWVSRCRVAAIAGGFLLVLALIITLPLVTQPRVL